MKATLKKKQKKTAVKPIRLAQTSRVLRWVFVFDDAKWAESLWGVEATSSHNLINVHFKGSENKNVLNVEVLLLVCLNGCRQ